MQKQKQEQSRGRGKGTATAGVRAKEAKLKQWQGSQKCTTLQNKATHRWRLAQMQNTEKNSPSHRSAPSRGKSKGRSRGKHAKFWE